MQYKIGDIADIFQISKEMIRYYEKQGVISSVRRSDNNYRMYSIWDIFSFLDFLQYKEMGSRKNIPKSEAGILEDIPWAEPWLPAMYRSMWMSMTD